MGLCPKCGIRERHETPSQTLSYCKPCYLAWQTERRSARRTEVRAYSKKYWEGRNLSASIWEAAKEDPVLYEKLRARWLVNQAVKAGKLVKPVNCERCHEETKLEAHHSDYSKPLEIEWLCKKCHVEEHIHGPEPE